jgi:hypothetical protein
MAEAAFPFLRATFYCWMQVWPEVGPELNKAPSVLGVGENKGRCSLILDGDGNSEERPSFRNYTYTFGPTMASRRQ